jgi:hypothetical protein
MAEATIARVRLTDWASRHFAPPPAERTLRLWVAEGRIVPAPIKVGRAYYVDPSARHIAVATRELTGKI